MLSGVNLKKTGQGWGFANEAALEDFIWTNLKSLLGLTPLKRQYYVKGEVCDILAVDDNRQLVVLELKNTEERYVVQQLTRYYDALLEVKPFQAEVDYDKAMRLVAVAPSFHRHNDIDRRHNKLSLEFFLFEVIQEVNTLQFNLNNTNGVTISKLTLPYSKEYISNFGKNIPLPRAIPRIPRTLQKVIENYSNDKQEIILNLRNRILRFNEHMGEKSTSVTIIYGKNKAKGQLCKSPSKLCAAFHSRSVLPSLDSPSILPDIELFLYLPFPKKTVSKGIMKIQIKTDDWQTVLGVRLPYKYGYYQANINTGLVDTETYLRIYEKITGKQAKSNSLDALVDMALEEWLERA